MNKVLLVDDEYLVCAFLKNLIVWEDYGFTVAGQASDGRKALEKVKELAPSLVFLDVSMPEMDGIQVLQILRSRFPHVRVVMLSSYSDFDYVRDTMKSGAVDYLLKHELTAEGLVKLLTSMGDLPRPGDRQPETAVEHRSPGIVRDSRTRSFFEKRLHEIPRALRGMKDILPVAARLRMSLADGSTGEGFPGEADRLQPILLTCGHISMEQGPAQVVLLRDGAILFLFGILHRESREEQRDRADRCMQIIHDALLKYHNTYMGWKMGNACAGPAQLPEEYERIAALPAVGEVPGRRKGSVSRLTIEQERRLLLAVLGKSTEKLAACMGDIFAPLREEAVTGTELSLLAGELLSLSVKLYQENGVPFPEQGEDRVVQMDLEQVYAYFLHLFTHLIGTIEQTEAFSRPVTAVLGYVQQHYRKELSLTDVAEHCGLNPSYLSTCFKKETGVSLINYINRVRVYAAGKLMLMENLPPTRVYEHVGFRNYNNFFNLFKSITGMAPKQFQEQSTVDWISRFDPLRK